MTPELQAVIAAFEAARRRFHGRVRVELDLTPTQIEQLREVIDNLPLNPYGPLVVAVLKALPLEPRMPHPTPWDDSPGERDPYLAGADEILPPSAVGTADPAAAESSRSSNCGGGFVIRAVSERGRAAMPYLESRLLAAGIPWTRKEA